LSRLRTGQSRHRHGQRPPAADVDGHAPRQARSGRQAVHSPRPAAAERRLGGQSQPIQVHQTATLAQRRRELSRRRDGMQLAVQPAQRPGVPDQPPRPPRQIGKHGRAMEAIQDQVRLGPLVHLGDAIAMRAGPGHDAHLTAGGPRTPVAAQHPPVAQGIDLSVTAAGDRLTSSSNAQPCSLGPKARQPPCMVAGGSTTTAPRPSLHGYGIGQDHVVRNASRSDMSSSGRSGFRHPHGRGPRARGGRVA
jgi:hypothetical protein